MKYVRLIRKDENAVSPVIATILMVAITVVLAAVLYVMVSGLLTGPGTGPRAMGVNIQASSDGSNWTVTVQTTPAGETPAGTFILIRSVSGTVQLQRKAFSLVTWATDKVVFQKADTTTTNLGPGDTLLISRTVYISGSQIEISDAAGVLTTRSLTG